MFLDTTKVFKRLSSAPARAANLQPPVSPLLNTRFIDQQRSHIQLKVPEGKRDPLEVIKGRFPRIYKTIIVQWGTRDLHEQFKKWIVCSRDSRQGWPMDVGQAILTLSKQHDERYKFQDLGALRYKRGTFIWEGQTANK